MKLLYQSHSPFARKALVFAYEAGLEKNIDVVHHETSPTNRNEEVYKLNPLGKVPILITDDNKIIFDSSVICNYLDGLHNKPKLIPQNRDHQIEALHIEALADGMSEIGIQARWESERRPETLRYPPLYKGLSDKLISSYHYIEDTVDLNNIPMLAQIALATTLSWLEFRELPPFDKKYPKLIRWYNDFIQRDSMKATTLTGDTHDD